jgi:hypothetical protein
VVVEVEVGVVVEVVVFCSVFLLGSVYSTER